MSEVDVLLETLPYIKRFQESTFVIKFGGGLLQKRNILKKVIDDITLLKYVGIQPVLVHGGGPLISEMLERLDIDSEFVEGLRVTDDRTMEIVEMVLAGKINKQVVSLLNAVGMPACGLTGKDGDLIEAEPYQQSGVDLGHVGRVSTINPEILVGMLDQYIPVIAPIGGDQQGETFNVNADTVASRLAAALTAEKLIFLTNVDGVLDQDGQLVGEIDEPKARKWIDNGKISGGMIPKALSCIQALDRGVKRTHILNGIKPHSLLLEIFTDRGKGTLIKKESNTHE
ncbi:MAG: acetylglutamate kinase [Bacillota bacterium]